MPGNATSGRIPHYNVMTWNVRGLSTNSKQRRIFTYLKSHKTHIAMLQETHMSQAGLENITRKWGGILHGTTTSSFARGVLIWISGAVPYVTTNIIKDPDGRYVVIEGELDGRPLTLAALYAPNVGHTAFFRKLSPALLTDPHTPVIWGGDFNGILDVELDRSTPPLRGTPCRMVTATLNDWRLNLATHDMAPATSFCKRIFILFISTQTIY